MTDNSDDRSGLGLIQWNINVSVAARASRADCHNDLRNMLLDGGPSALPQDHNGNFATGEVLLVAQIAVCSYQYLKSPQLRRR